MFIGPNMGKGCLRRLPGSPKALAPRLCKLEPEIHVQARVNGSIMRINRDIRTRKTSLHIRTTSTFGSGPGRRKATSPAMQAVVPLGACSGVLVRPDRLLTSAHCLKPGLEQVAVAGRTFHLSACEAHPDYRPLQAARDVAVCRLAAPAPVDDIAVDEGPAAQPGQAVTLAGYGLPGALAHALPELRAVETAIVRIDAQGFEVGTDDRTACLGDSGGPVLIQRGGVLRVAGILHGPSGAICSSPARAARLDVAADWLARELASSDAAGGTHVVVRIAIGLLAVVAATLVARSVARRMARTRRYLTNFLWDLSRVAAS
jgi:hypothetical protein